MVEKRIIEFAIRRIDGSGGSQHRDLLAAEEPLEIRIEGHSVAIVMRTPGDDRELAAGFLLTEGLVRKARDIIEITPSPHCLQSPEARVASSSPGSAGPSSVAVLRRVDVSPASPRSHPPARRRRSQVDLAGDQCNVIEVRLAKPESLDLKKLTRHLFSSSSCGICSKASIDAVRQQFPPVDDPAPVDPKVLLGLPSRLSFAQETFKRTGGLHACALFDLAGNLIAVREDVGRHNALDKLIGWALMADELPLRRRILLLSGRASFELMQKALAAGIPIVAAISAPSSLAVEFAHESGQTLIGFLRGEKMNIYAGASRVQGPDEGTA